VNDLNVVGTPFSFLARDQVFSKILILFRFFGCLLAGLVTAVKTGFIISFSFMGGASKSIRVFATHKKTGRLCVSKLKQGRVALARIFARGARSLGEQFAWHPWTCGVILV